MSDAIALTGAVAEVLCASVIGLRRHDEALYKKVFLFALLVRYSVVKSYCYDGGRYWFLLIVLR